MNQATLKKRYGLSTKQLGEIIHSNLAELNNDGQHATLDGSHWSLDDDGVAKLDKILHYVPDLPVQASEPSKNALKIENDELKSKIKELQDCLLKAEATLKQTHQNFKREKQEYEQQLEELTRQVCDTQEGQKNLNENLIRKYKNEADKARYALEYEREKANDKIESLSNMVKELQNRAEENTEKLRKYLDLRNENLRLQTEIAVSGEEQQKLLKDLHAKTDKISKLEDVINTANQANNDNAMVNTLLIKDVNLALQEFLSTISTLQSSIEGHSISEESMDTLTSEIEAVSDRQRKLLGHKRGDDDTSSGVPETEASSEESTDETISEIAEEGPEAQAPEFNEKETAAEVADDSESPVEEDSEVKPAKVEKGKKSAEENKKLDKAIRVLRESQENRMREAKEENERKNKGFFARVASWFVA